MTSKIFAALSSAAMLVACGQADSGAEGSAGETYIQAHTIQELMANVVQPQAEVFWGAAGSVSDETGTHDLRPATDERWMATVSAAATVAEMGNLLMTPQYAEGRGEDWIAFSRGLVEVGQRAEKAAAERASEDELFRLGGEVYNVCTACHEAYPQESEGAQSELEGPAAE